MIYKVFSAIIIGLILFLPPSHGQNPVYKDIYGREVISADGKKINYPASGINQSGSDPESLKVFTRSAEPTKSNILKDTVNFKSETLYSTMGIGIGRISMHSVDLDKDGVLELICTASTSSYIEADYWYILHYNEADSTCQKIWMSNQYDHNISALEVVDLNNDMNYKILLGFDDGTLKLYDGLTRELLKEAKTVNEQIRSIVYSDADNDNIQDIIVSCTDNTYLLDANTYTLKHTINKGADNVRVGNVNDDPYNEIVLSSGTVYQILNSSLIVLWDFDTSEYHKGHLELSDIDQDLKNEIILAKSYYDIKIYDADTKTTKYSLDTEKTIIDCLLLQDINNDGIDEILYGEGHTGKIYCINSVTRAEIWSVSILYGGVTAINYADLDNDGKEELIWGTGWDSSDSDFLNIYDVSLHKLEWRSPDITGPFYALAYGDTDSDGRDEIVGVSYSSESGFYSGVIVILDALTKKLKWECPPHFLPLRWSGILDVEIHDIDNDNNNEIVIGAGNYPYGKILIIDGKNHVIKSSHEFFTEQILGLYSLEIDDVDGDANYEIIASNKTNLYVINPSDWSVKWSVDISDSSERSALRCAEINNDGQKEIIVLRNGTIQIIKCSDHSIWTSSGSKYSNIDIFDANRDMVSDIVASTTDGHIVVLDGKTGEIIKDMNPEVDEILSLRTVYQNDSVLYIYSCNGRINFYANDSRSIVSQYFGRGIAEFEALKIFNNNDTITTIFGTRFSLIQLTYDDLKCMNFYVTADKIRTACSKNDGKIFLNVTGGTEPYSYLWADGSTLDSITNLAAGIFSVRVKDSGDCITNRSFTLDTEYISGDIEVVSETCSENGSAHLILNHFNPPYDVIWSNNYTSLDNDSLVAGTYWVTVTDSKYCEFKDTVTVTEKLFRVLSTFRDAQCYGSSDGFIYLTPLRGEKPITYDWNFGYDGYFATNLKEGSYNVRVTDASGCNIDLSFYLTQPDKISYTVSTYPDNMGTSDREGEIIIENLSGGTPPYKVYWPYSSKSSEHISALTQGNYSFEITDDNGCRIVDNAEVETYADFLHVYPNPAADELFISLESVEIHEYNYELINSNGEILKSNVFVSKDTERVDLSGLSPGFYLLRLRTNNSSHTLKIVIR